MLGGKALPSELETLLKWHNGQEWNSLLSKEDNRRLMTASEIINAWQFFNDPMSDFMEPWSTSWVPILTNDSGDYIVYETEGKNAGKLLAYWHDWENRSVQNESVLVWAQGLLKEYK